MCTLLMADTSRPSMATSLYDRVKVCCVCTEHTIRSILEEATEIVVTDGGEFREGWKRVSAYAENNDVAKHKVINHILVQVIKENGDADIKYKERLDLDDL